MKTALLLALLLVGCGGPVGVVRTGEPLDAETEQAVEWWAAAGEQIHMTCNEHDAHCVTVRYADRDCAGKTDGWGCTLTDDWTLAKDVTISPKVPPGATLRIVAHELGHVLGREHTDAPELMAPTPVNGAPNCIDGALCRVFWFGGDIK